MNLRTNVLGVATADLAHIPPTHADYLLCCDADLLHRGVVLSPEMLIETRWHNGLVTAGEQQRQRALVNRRRHLATMAAKTIPFVGPTGCQCPPDVIKGDCPFSYANGFHARTRALRAKKSL